MFPVGVVFERHLIRDPGKRNIWLRVRRSSPSAPVATSACPGRSQPLIASFITPPFWR
jgi:hypothetical protein